MYLKFNWLSTFFIFMLFAIGGLVRSTGSGMGCPDWPKCFGEYIPPLSESELPPDYETYFKEQRKVKTERFTQLLEAVGFSDKAKEIREHKQLDETHQFNVIKAYVEYINRLWGAVTGIIVFLCLLFSLQYFKTNKSVFFLTLLGFISVFFNALLGAVVVNSNLLGGIVTTHFIVAFAAISFFVLARIRAINPSPIHAVTMENKRIAIVLLSLCAVQVILGANVRELYDQITTLISIPASIETMYPKFHWHAILGVVILTVGIYQFIKSPTDQSKQYIKYVLWLSIAQLVWGPMALLESTASISKLFHITIGAGIFILQFYICSSYLLTTKRHH